ncbi:UNC93-like protein MFSD11 [Bolinopsis microptera]|uniref:UNC93-like protein MFSD11 n=1 Tax=Bolinopsis microptera TaxID=2820187 RepID=UPI003079BAB2
MSAASPSSDSNLKKRLSKSISTTDAYNLKLNMMDVDKESQDMLAKNNRIRTRNIFINAVAVMLVYSSYYGGAAVMPTAFSDMDGRHGVDKHTAFTGLMINNLFVVIAAFVTPFIMKLIGMRLSLVLGSMCSIPITLALFMPYNFTIFIGQAINGIGNAFSRAVSLQFLSENSTKEKMARNSGIHWMIFMSCILFGNTVLYFGIGDKKFLDDNTRMVVSGALTAMCVTGCILYCFTVTPPPLPPSGLEDEEAPLIGKKMSFSSAGTSSRSDSESTAGSKIEDYDELTLLGQLKTSLRPLFKRKNIYLLLPLCSTGIYSQLYTPLIPAYIGILFEERSFVAQFGIFVGLGEIIGGRPAGKIVARLGFKRTAVITTTLGVAAYLLIAFMFPLFYSHSVPALYPNRWGNNMLGIAIGIIDVTNNVIITTAIGTVYKDDSAQIFTLVVLMMNSSGIIRYIMMSYMPLVAIVSVNVIGLVGSCGSLCLIPSSMLHY